MPEEKGKATIEGQRPQPRASEVQDELSDGMMDKVVGGAGLGDISIGKTADSSSPK